MKSLGKDIQISVEKIDFEDLIKDFKVLSIDTFTLYLKELWKVSNRLNVGSFWKKWWQT